MQQTISPASPWHENLRNEMKRFHELYVDVDKMITQAREADRVRSQMVILERRVQVSISTLFLYLPSRFS